MDDRALGDDDLIFFIRKNLLNPELTGFAGFENYKYLWEDPAFVPAIINSIILIGAVLVITVVLGTLFAVLFDRDFLARTWRRCW